MHLASGGDIEVRLAGWIPDVNVPVFDHAAGDVRFKAVVFGSGNYGSEPKIGRCRRRSILAIGWPLALWSRPSSASSTTHGSSRFALMARGRTSGRSRPPRSPYPVRACARCPRALGYVDADCGAAAGVRTAVGQLRPRLALDSPDAGSRHSLRVDHARRRDLLDGRSRSRSATAARRAVSNSDSHCCRCQADQDDRRSGRRGRHNRRAGTRACSSQERWRRGRGKWPRGSADRADDGLARRRCHRLWYHEPDSSHYELLRAFLSEDTFRTRATSSTPIIPNSRIRRFDVHRAREPRGALTRAARFRPEGGRIGESWRHRDIADARPDRDLRPLDLDRDAPERAVERAVGGLYASR